MGDGVEQIYKYKLNLTSKEERRKKLRWKEWKKGKSIEAK